MATFLRLFLLVGLVALSAADCSYKGRTYPSGEFMDECRRCRCEENGNVGCVGCPITVPSGCQDEGGDKPEGARWSLDPCGNTCTCKEGRVRCTMEVYCHPVMASWYRQLVALARWRRVSRFLAIFRYLSGQTN